MFDFLRIRQNKIHKFKPKVEIYSDKGPFVLKTVTDTEELIDALKLRYQVFHREMIGKLKPRGIDVDEFDFMCDHLIIKEKTTGKVVGTYRLNCSLYSKEFYSSSEFNLEKIQSLPGPKLELGRACIDKDFRRGMVISLLWRGIAEYMTKTNSSVFFGCASIKTESPRQAALIYQYFSSQGYFVDEYLCPPTLKYSMPHLDLWIQKLKRPLIAEELSEVDSLIPALCKAYLKAGAYFGGEPAYDLDFKCIDFLTILPRENLNKVLWRKYSSNSKAESEPQAVSV